MTNALIFDATGLSSADELRALYDFFHYWLPTLGRCGRVLVIGRPPESNKNPGKAAAQAALEGFTRSITKPISSIFFASSDSMLMSLLPSAEAMSAVSPL